MPTGVAAVDLNGDGNLDFVVSYAATNNLGVFLGHGDGTFTASSVALSATPTKIAVADFAGTTAPDIAVLSSGDLTSASGGANSQIILLENDGAAHFHRAGQPDDYRRPGHLPGIRANRQHRGNRSVRGSLFR